MLMRTSFKRSRYLLTSCYVGLQGFSLLLLSRVRHLFWDLWRRDELERLVLLLGFELLLPRLLGQSLFESSLLNIPIIHEIKVISLSDEGFPEHRDELLVVRLLLKLQLPRIIKEVLKFFRIARAQIFNTGHSLFDLNLLVLFLFGLRR